MEMDDFKKLPKMACFKEGGFVTKKEFTKFEKTEAKDDKISDTKMVKSGVRQHESALHKGEPKTELKLKTGGRAKKAVGSAKRFEKAPASPSAATKTKNTVSKYKAGGNVTNVYEAKKKAGDKDAIKKVKEIKPSKADAPSKATKVAKNTPAKFCGGKSVKKMAEGKSVGGQGQISDYERGAFNKLAKPSSAAGQGQISDYERNLMSNISKLDPAQQAEFAKQQAEATAKYGVNKKTGGKVKKLKKYADGGAVLSDAEKAWLGGADATDPFIRARMQAAVADKAPQGSYIPNADPAMDNRDMGMTGGSIDDESKFGAISPAAAAFNKNIPGAGVSAPVTPRAPVRRVAPRPNAAMIEDESNRGVVTPAQQNFNKSIAGSGAYMNANPVPTNTTLAGRGVRVNKKPMFGQSQRTIAALNKPKVV